MPNYKWNGFVNTVVNFVWRAVVICLVVWGVLKVGPYVLQWLSVLYEGVSNPVQ